MCLDGKKKDCAYPSLNFSDMIRSRIKSMWILAMFDLPTNTKQERRDMTVFRKLLQSQGLFRMQFSVYARFCDNQRLKDTILRTIRQGVPQQGEVRLIYVTDKQYSEMLIFEGAVKKRSEPEPEQLTFF